MPQVRPFRGLYPAKLVAQQVIAPPYDVVSEAEARAIVAANPRSFLRVTRGEVGLPEGSDPHGPEAYAKAAENLAVFKAEGLVLEEQEPCLYQYTLRMGTHLQSGLMATCRTDDYDAGVIRRHEFTRPDKELDRVNHIDAVNAQTGLVFLAHRAHPDVAALHTAALASEPLFDVVTPDGVQHTLRRIASPAAIAAWQAAFQAIDVLYIADGHHRSAAASRVAAARGGTDADPHRWFLVGIFPDDQLQCLAYNRLVADLAGRSPEELRAALGAVCTLEDGVEPAPAGRGSVHMYLDGRWTALAPRPGVVPADDPVARLDVAWLQDLVLRPLLGVENPRTDERIRFVGGIRGTQALERAVQSGEAQVAFSLFPTGLDQLFAVADSGRVMPPKSTWFEPKLAGGVLVHPLTA